MRVVAVTLLLFGCGPRIGSTTGQASGGLATTDSIPDDYVATPHGYYHESCVHDASEGDPVTLRSLPCEYPRLLVRNNPDTANGWVEDANFLAPTPAQKMTSELVVPSAPSSSAGQLDYFFPGMTPTDGSVILQPVLAWGKTPAGGGDYFSIASWSCGPSCVHGNLIEVATGDKIAGTITGFNCTSSGSCDWNIETNDLTSGAIASLSTRDDSNVYPWLFLGVLEAYHVTACDQFPAAGDMKFSDVKFYDSSDALIAPTWAKTTVDGSLGCNYAVKTTKETATLSFGPGSSTDGGTTDSGTTDGGTTCEYTCAQYGFAAGQCYNDWQCGSDGCLTAVASCPG